MINGYNVEVELKTYGFENKEDTSVAAGAIQSEITLFRACQKT